MVSTKLKKNDVVYINSGDDKGKRGRILNVDTEKGRVTVEGINKHVRHVKASKANPNGGKVTKEFPIDISNVMIFCEKCKKGVRIGVEMKNDSKVRICKKCGKSID